MQQDFLWGKGDGGQKVCWVSWGRICHSVHEGGLGVKNIETFNYLLISKWGWRFLTDKEAVWSNFLEYR